jgi:hypothetical protein
MILTAIAEAVPLLQRCYRKERSGNTLVLKLTATSSRYPESTGVRRAIICVPSIANERNCGGKIELFEDQQIKKPQHSCSHLNISTVGRTFNSLTNCFVYGVFRRPTVVVIMLVFTPLSGTVNRILPAR